LNQIIIQLGYALKVTNFFRYYNIIIVHSIKYSMFIIYSVICENLPIVVSLEKNGGIIILFFYSQDSQDKDYQYFIF